VSAPGFLAVGGVEVANNARTVAYLQRGMGGPWFQAITAQACPDLTQEAWPLSTCPAGQVDDMIFSAPYATWLTPLTGAAPPAAGTSAAVFDPSGVMGSSVAITAGQTGWAVPPDPGVAAVRVRVAVAVYDPANASGFEVGVFRALGVGGGAANFTTTGPAIRVQSNTMTLRQTWRFPGGTTSSQVLATPTTTLGIGVYWLEVDFTASGYLAKVYCTHPDSGQPPAASVAYGYDGGANAGLSGAWSIYGPNEQTVFSTATRVVLGNVSASFPAIVTAGITEYAVIPTCTATGDLYPSDGLWPADDLYPALYGEFHDPGTDNAPWVDADRPEGYGFLGLLVSDITGLDTTSTRPVDSAADGIGGIIGPETLEARAITVKGWLIATDGSAMEYARRWLAETLADSLCEGCDLSFVDLRTTCGDDPAGDFYTNRWTLYDVGLTSMDTDTSDSESCDYVTPIQFTLTAGDPYLYGPVLNVSGPTTLNPGGSDATLVPFESWLFTQPAPACLTISDQGIGVDSAIFTFNGGTSGIEGGIAAPSLGTYPAASLWPSDCLYPSDGATQWTNDDCPFAFTFEIGPGEQFVINGPRRLLQWVLSDGTVLDGSPQMLLGTGDVIEWINTCAGASVDACAVAFAGCTCDDTATVQIQTQHRER